MSLAARAIHCIINSSGSPQTIYSNIACTPITARVKKLNIDQGPIFLGVRGEETGAWPLKDDQFYALVGLRMGDVFMNLLVLSASADEHR